MNIYNQFFNFLKTFQWTNETNAGFTNITSTPWLPISEDHDVFNVENQKTKYLELFRNISKLREMDAFQKGKTYFPLHDIDIFSFLRFSFLIIFRNFGLIPTRQKNNTRFFLLQIFMIYFKGKRKIVTRHIWL